MEKNEELFEFDTIIFYRQMDNLFQYDVDNFFIPFYGRSVQIVLKGKKRLIQYAFAARDGDN